MLLRMAPFMALVPVGLGLHSLKKTWNLYIFRLNYQQPLTIKIVTRIGDNAFSGYSSEKGNMKDAIGNLGTDDCKFMIVGIVNLANDHLAEIGKYTDSMSFLRNVVLNQLALMP